MAKSLPSLALEMSHKGISLHQLAFDGHWHEVSCVALDDAALGARLANMRSMAAGLEGRRFKTRIWLPEDQIFQLDAGLSSGHDTGHVSGLMAQARAAVAERFGGKAGDYMVAIGAKNQDGRTAVAAVRLLTMKEALHFAKSHGFRANGFSFKSSLPGFPTAPVFKMPLEKGRLAALGAIAASAAALVLVGGYSFYKIDPLGLWEQPPLVASFAPFQRPDPGIERAKAPALPAGGADVSSLPAFAALAPVSPPPPRPTRPPRQLMAAVQVGSVAPPPPASEDLPQVLHPVAPVGVNWPQKIAGLPAASAHDPAPNIGFINLVGRIAEPLQPDVKPAPHALPAPQPTYKAASRPITVANTAFFLEPLPAVATRLSPEALAAFATKSGLGPAQLAQMARPILLAESKLIDITPGLPKNMPLLRSGRAIPKQGAAPQAPSTAASSMPAPLFTLVQGRPTAMPPRRPKPPAVADSQLVPAAPVTLDASAAPAAPVTLDAPVAPVAPVSIALPASTADAESMAAAVQAAVDGVASRDGAALYSLRQGLPPLLPRLRSGGALPGNSKANSLRPPRRPLAIINMPPPPDPMISSAAPATSARPSHRTAAFAANAARIIGLMARQPRASTPSVPADPRRVDLPTSASVARTATIQHAFNLRRTNLLGVYGTADARTALIRLAGGRLVRVQRGQSFSGWTVVAITANTVRVKKRSREEILRMPTE